jgi:hypothetical protein
MRPLGPQPRNARGSQTKDVSRSAATSNNVPNLAGLVAPSGDLRRETGRKLGERRYDSVIRCGPKCRPPPGAVATTSSSRMPLSTTSSRMTTSSSVGWCSPSRSQRRTAALSATSARRGTTRADACAATRGDDDTDPTGMVGCSDSETNRPGGRFATSGTSRRTSSRDSLARDQFHGRPGRARRRLTVPGHRRRLGGSVPRDHRQGRPVPELRGASLGGTGPLSHLLLPLAQPRHRPALEAVRGEHRSCADRSVGRIAGVTSSALGKTSVAPLSSLAATLPLSDPTSEVESASRWMSRGRREGGCDETHCHLSGRHLGRCWSRRCGSRHPCPTQKWQPLVPTGSTATRRTREECRFVTAETTSLRDPIIPRHSPPRNLALLMNLSGLRRE